MKTVTISLDDDTYERLEQKAEERGTTVEDLLASAGIQILEIDRIGESSAEGEAARAMARKHLDRYPELFRRLGE